MASPDPLLAALKPLLKARGITYKALGVDLGLSEPSTSGCSPGTR